MSIYRNPGDRELPQFVTNVEGGEHQIVDSMGRKPWRMARYVCFLTQIFFCILLLPVILRAQVADPSTLNNKILVGYQGWFNAPGDGSVQGWSHWSHSSTDIGTGLYNVDVWPDISEFDPDELFAAPHVTLLDGSTGQLFSSRIHKTTERHFKWMKENGIDGIMLQRFIAQYLGASFFNHNTVLENVRDAATTHGRVFMIEYDITGQGGDVLYNNITQDWKYLVDHYDILHHPRYLHHNGKPVIGIWGIGVDDRPNTPASAAQVIDFFRNNPVYGGCSVCGGISPGWRDLTGGQTDPAWASVYRSLDVISPWTVGGYNSSGVSAYKTNYVVPDLTECNRLGIAYLQVVWPGFSWDNEQGLPPGTSNFPRNNGQFLWDQVSAYQSAGVKMMKVAMFDECDEGTAILKVSENHPVTDHWIDYAGYKHDWYMRLAGAAGRMLRKEIPISSSLPAPIPLDPICNGDEVSINLGEDVADRMTHPQNADGNTVVTTIGGVSCRKNVSTSTDLYMYFAVADSFAFQGNRHEVCVTIDYYNPLGSTGSLRLDYDSDTGNTLPAFYKNGGSVTLGTSNTWQRKIFHLTDAYFGNRQNAGADFRIAKTTTGNFYLDRVLVTSTVAKPAVIELDSTSFAKTIAQGGQATSDSLTVINMGIAPLNYTAGTNAAWLSVTPASGKSTGESDVLSVIYNTSGLSRGHYSALISVTDPGASNSPQTIPVNLDVIGFADFDGDSDVDQQDFGRFQVCLTGLGVAYAPGCLAGDSNGDGAVDFQDVSAFIHCMNGANRLPGC